MYIPEYSFGWYTIDTIYNIVYRFSQRNLNLSWFSFVTLNFSIAAQNFLMKMWQFLQFTYMVTKQQFSIQSRCAKKLRGEMRYLRKWNLFGASIGSDDWKFGFSLVAWSIRRITQWCSGWPLTRFHASTIYCSWVTIPLHILLNTHVIPLSIPSLIIRKQSLIRSSVGRESSHLRPLVRSVLL